MTRREFLAGSTAGVLSVATAGCLRGRKGPAAIDPSLVVVVADIHIPLPLKEQRYRTGREYPWIIDTVKAHIDEILSLDPLPANVIALGDLSIAFGEEKEYAILRELLQPLYDRGIAVTLGMGNHDIRASYAKSFPEAAATSLVPGRYVHRVETPSADFVLLDSLVEPSPAQRGKYGALTKCALDDKQLAWMKDYAAKATRPTLFAAHHSASALGIEKYLARAPQVFGFLHGHHHRWINAYLRDGYRTDKTVRSLGLPSFAIDNDIGYAVLRTTPDGVTATFVERDFFFPEKPTTDRRHPLWRDIVRDNDGRVVRFPFAK